MTTGPIEPIWRQGLVCIWCEQFIESHEAHVRPNAYEVYHQDCYQPAKVAARLSKGMT